MPQEIYKIWRPIPDAPRFFNWRSLSDTLGGLSLELEHGDDPSQLLKITFLTVEAYRACDEGRRLKTLEAMSKQLASCAYPFLKIENSSFLEWYHAESLYIWVERPIEHYQIGTSGDIIDVLSEAEPMVEWQ